MFRIVDHPCLGQTRKALAQFIYQKKDPVTCRRKLVVKYLHNNGFFYPYPFSPLHCPAAYTCTSAAEQALSTVNLSGV